MASASSDDDNLVYIDLDTDGGVSGHHLLYEIAATTDGGNITFNEKIDGCQNLPKNRGRRLSNLLSLKDALTAFLNWLKSLPGRKTYLVAHNAKNFDAIIFVQSLDKCNIRIPTWIEFVDSIDVILELQELGICKFNPAVASHDGGFSSSNTYLGFVIGINNT